MARLYPSTVYVWLLLVLFFLVAPAHAQSRREREAARNLQAGIGAFEDGLYDDAHRFFTQAQRRAQDLDVEEEILLWLVRTDFARQRYGDILTMLDEETVAAARVSMRPQLQFWRARAYFADEQYDMAIEELTSILEADLPEDLVAARLRLFGRAYARSGRHASAIRVFEQFDQDHGDHPERSANRLDWASSLLENGQVDSAKALLDQMIAMAGEHPIYSTAVLWRANLYLDGGDLEEARQLLESFVEADQIPPDDRAQGGYLLAAVFERDNQLQSAFDALVAGQQVASSAAIRHEGRILQARLHFRQQQWSEGMQLLRLTISETSSDSIAGRAQLELGEAYLSQYRHAEALRVYQEYLESFEHPDGRAQALLGRAWSLLGLRRPLEAAASFEEAYALHPELMERERALFKVADSYFDSQRYDRAREEYLLVTQVFPGSSLVPMALFQAAECLARQRYVAEAVAEFRAIEDAFPNSVYAERSAMRIGGLQEEIGEWDRAISAYNRLMASYPDGALFADALHRRAMIRYRLGLFAEALADFERVVEQFPRHPAMEQAFYMRGWCLYLLGENEQALEVCETFLRRYPHSKWVPDVLFWLAAYTYNQGDFSQAEARFRDLAESSTSDELKASSLYWAGRSAMQREEFLTAINYFNQVARDFPRSALLPDVRFAQGDALSHLGEFSGAILAFEEVIRRHPDHALVARAWGRKGDCQFTLGSENPERYREAIASFQAVLDRPDVTIGLRVQAEYKQGRAHEELGETEEALSRYLQIVYDLVGERAVRGRETAVWFTRAAFAAAAIKENQGQQEDAVRILSRVIEAEVPAAPDAQHRIDRILQLSSS